MVTYHTVFALLSGNVVYCSCFSMYTGVRVQVTSQISDLPLVLRY